MIHLHTGQPGNGKTSWAVRQMFNLDDKGMNVYAIGVPQLKDVPVATLNKRVAFYWYETEQTEIIDDLLNAVENATKNGMSANPADLFDLDGYGDIPLLSKWIPPNSTVIIDEAHFVFPKTGSKIPPHVLMLSLHRHYGIDFILLTQFPDKIHPDVMGLVGKHTHVASRWSGRKIYEWSTAQRNPDAPSVRDDAASQAYKLDKEMFKHYHSSSKHIKVTRKIPATAYAFGLVFLVSPFVFYYTFDRMSDRFNAEPTKVTDLKNNPVSKTGMNAPIHNPYQQTTINQKPKIISCTFHGVYCSCLNNQYNEIRYLHPFTKAPAICKTLSQS